MIFLKQKRVIRYQYFLYRNNKTYREPTRIIISIAIHFFVFGLRRKSLDLRLCVGRDLSPPYLNSLHSWPSGHEHHVVLVEVHLTRLTMPCHVSLFEAILLRSFRRPPTIVKIWSVHRLMDVIDDIHLLSIHPTTSYLTLNDVECY